MAGRSPARFLAPIALVAFAVALYTVVKDTNPPAGGKSGGQEATTPTSTATKSKAKAKQASKRKRRTYTVKNGDTPSGIAEKTGVSLDTLYELNPDLDPQTLAPGQRIRLSE